jgi:hypothetical protein
VSIFKTTAQEGVTITGIVLDATTNEALPGASIVHQRGKGTITDIDGAFLLQITNPGESDTLKIHFVGYHVKEVIMKSLGPRHAIGNIYLLQDEITINEVEIQGKVPIAVQKGDTLSFKASAVKVNEDAKGINLVKKLPGFKVGENKIEVQGEKVQAIYIDGKPFFEDDPKQALNALPADVIKSIELYDDYGEIAAFTGYASGNSTKAINIITKKGSRQNWLGNLSAGLGIDGQYNVENTLMYANEKHDLTILNDNNNVNKSRADMSDFGGFESRIKNKMGLALTDEPLAGEQSTRNLATNYHFEPNKNTKLSLNYTYGRQENKLKQQRFQRYQDALCYDISDTSQTNSQRHKLNLKYTYEKGNNKIIVSEKISHLDGSFEGTTFKNSYTDEAELSNSLTGNLTESNELYSATSAIWLHKFAESGRSLATIANIKIQSNNKSSSLESLISNTWDERIDYQNDEDLNSYENKVYGRIAYKEPLSIFSNLNFVLSTTYGWSGAEKETLLSSSYEPGYSLLEDDSEFTYSINRAEIGYSSLGMKFVFNAGLGLEQSIINKDFILPDESYNQSQSGYNLHPLIFGKYFISSKQTLSFFLRGSTTLPGISQLQPTVTMNEPLKVTVGNPNLESGVQYLGVARYVQTNSEKSRYFSAYIFARYNDDFIGVENYFTSEAQQFYGYDIAAGTNVFMPVNLDGYFNITSGADYAFPIRPLRSNLNVGLRYTFSEIPTVMQGIAVDGQNHTGGLKLSLASNISQKIDFLLSHELGYNQTSNSQTSSTTQFIQNNLSIEGSFEFIDSWVLGFDGNFKSYNYFNDYSEQQYTLLNASITKQFLKNDRASLELRAYDILDQNQSVSFDIHETYTEQIQSNNLQQHVMLTFKYKF